MWTVLSVPKQLFHFPTCPPAHLQLRVGCYSWLVKGEATESDPTFYEYRSTNKACDITGVTDGCCTILKMVLLSSVVETPMSGH